MERRALGLTGRNLSVIGFGGIVVQDETPRDAARFVSHAVERGINFFDVAPAYGNAEERLGPALEPYRADVFLAGKTRSRTAGESAADLRETLRRLRTDRLDLYQFHAVDTVDDAERILGAGGAMETFLKARDAGLIRHIGFSSHNEETALFMLDRFPFDVIFFPVNFACWLRGGFGPRAIERAQRTGVGIVAIKPLCRSPLLRCDANVSRRAPEWVHSLLRKVRRLRYRYTFTPRDFVRGKTSRPAQPDRNRKWPKLNYHPVDDPESVGMALRFALARPVTSALPPGQSELLWMACDALEQPASHPQVDENGLVEALGGVPLHSRVA